MDQYEEGETQCGYLVRHNNDLSILHLGSSLLDMGESYTLYYGQNTPLELLYMYMKSDWSIAMCNSSYNTPRMATSFSVIKGVLSVHLCIIV